MLPLRKASQMHDASPRADVREPWTRPGEEWRPRPAAQSIAAGRPRYRSRARCEERILKDAVHSRLNLGALRPPGAKVSADLSSVRAAIVHPALKTIGAAPFRPLCSPDGCHARK